VTIVAGARVPDTVYDAVMRWKKLRLVLAALIGACLLLWVRTVYWPDILTVSYAEYCRVRPGMNQSEVDSLFGGSASVLGHNNPIRKTESFGWDGCAGSAYVEFDQVGRVIGKQYFPRADWDNADATAREQIRSEWRRIVSQRRRAAALDDLIWRVRRLWQR
jgi:hypothetical protein